MRRALLSRIAADAARFRAGPCRPLPPASHGTRRLRDGDAQPPSLDCPRPRQPVGRLRDGAVAEVQRLPEDPGLIWRAVSVAGFLLLVSAYLVNQVGRCQPSSRRYLGANALGAGLLAAYSGVIHEPVFVALEGFWSAASVWALLRTRADDGGSETRGDATGGVAVGPAVKAAGRNSEQGSP